MFGLIQFISFCFSNKQKWPADLYLEGSDNIEMVSPQNQGTRGRAPESVYHGLVFRSRT